MLPRSLFYIFRDLASPQNRKKGRETKERERKKEKKEWKRLGKEEKEGGREGEREKKKEKEKKCRQLSSTVFEMIHNSSVITNSRSGIKTSNFFLFLEYNLSGEEI